MGLGEFFNWYHDNGILPNLWKGFSGQLSNEQIEAENMQYQRERNDIEDTRYEDETSYNRAFQEDERDYQRMFAQDERAYNRAFSEEQRDYERALQQQIFEREDTAIQRQADQLSAIGINPLSQNMQGLGSGSVVSASGYSGSSAGSAVGSPSLSSRGGDALHKDLKAQGLNDMMGYVSGIADTINQYKTGNLTRDSLALQNDKQFLQNLKAAHDLGIDYKGVFSPTRKYGGYIKFGKKYQMDFTDDNGESIYDADYYKNSSHQYFYGKERQVNSDKHAIQNNYYDTDNEKTRFLKDLGSDDYESILQKVLTKGVNLIQNTSKDLKGTDKNLMTYFIDKIFSK